MNFDAYSKSSSFRVKIENSTWIGFVLGMIQDAVAGSAVFGLSALTKSLTGYFFRK